MKRSHPRTRTRAGTLATALADATRAADRSLRAHLDPDRTPDPVVVSRESWRMVHLFGTLGYHTAALAARVGACSQHYSAPADDGVPADQVARACRALAELRQALDDAQRAAREIYSTFSHLEVHRRADTGSGPDTSRKGA
ncbi:MAG TPA: hypothetical protein VNO31_04400 [Umezawaea sp.]|nr:hypothetical protein [Umezawaea sp.]